MDIAVALTITALALTLLSSPPHFCLCLEDSEMGNRVNKSSSPTFLSKKKSKTLPIDTIFKLPSSTPTWPPGEGFASGAIDLGGLQVYQIQSFTKVWATHEGGPDNLGATFFEPSSIPEGFFTLGFYSQSNNKPLFGWVLVGKDVTADPSRAALKQPIDYSLIWSSDSLKIKQDGNSYIWLPMPPDGYKAIGHVVTSSPEKPSLDKIRCVRSDLTDVCEIDTLIWGAKGFNVYTSRPIERGVKALGLPAGTFVAQNSGAGNESFLACLKNVNSNFSAMPNLRQIQALVQVYSPWIYFHSKEKFLPSSVSWFFDNGALLYKKGEESKPVTIEPMGSNLPQGDSSDGSYWLDLPVNESAKETVMRGNLQDAGVYLHIKSTCGATFTDIAIWVFYPFNGPAKVKVEFINLSLGKIGQHVGDWEHVTLRISNFNGELKSLYFSQHSKGIWVDASQLEFENGNKPVAYAALYGHAFFPKAGLVLQGSRGMGIRNETEKSKIVMDSGARFVVVGGEYLGSDIVEPPWLNYAREWGPKVSYDIADEIRKVAKVLPWKLKSAFLNVVKSLPNEVLGEEGPTGPKWKINWSGDERV